MSKLRLIFLLFFGFTIFGWMRVEATPGDTVADAVLGQFNLTSNAANGGGSVSATGLKFTSDMAVYAQTGRLYVADYDNHRVLSWPNAESFTNGAPADIVIGQNNFNSGLPNQGGGPTANTLSGPIGLAIDQRTGRLYVSDFLNHRVLSYGQPIITGKAADHVYGQPNFTSNTINNGGLSANSLNLPWGVAFDSDSGYLFVADWGNNRVLQYGTGFNPTAISVYGQPDFTSDTPNNGGISNHSLFHPAGIAYEPDSTTLAVADSDNNRVLLFILDISTTDAEFVLGQNGSFNSNTSNNGGLSAKSLFRPIGLTFDSSRDLYLADYNNHRVLYYDLNLNNSVDDTADLVFGQPDFTSNTINNGGISANSLHSPNGVTITPNQNLLVADRNNNRLLRFDRPRAYGLPGVQEIWPDQVIVGTQDFELLVVGNGFVPQSTVTWNGSSLITTYLNPTHLTAFVPASHVSAMFNAQIRVVNPSPGGGMSINQATMTGYIPTDDDRTADRILGKPGFTPLGYYSMGEMGLGARFLDGSTSSAIDPVTGRLYVADEFNHRILSWPSANVINSSAADMVFGQPDFYSDISNAGGVSASSLSLPHQIAVDENSNLYVADTNNHRVLVYQDPASTDTIADFVFGQAGFSTNSPNPGGATANTMQHPTGVTVGPDGTMYVSEFSNHRILIFFNPLTTDRTADIVLGQVNFTSISANQGNPSPGASTLSGPYGLALDTDGLLYAAEYNNNRVVVYSPPFVNGQAASFVFGQPNFTSNTANNGGISAASLAGPSSVTVNTGGKVYISDSINNRVLAYDDPISQNNKIADRVFGQPDFTSSAGNNGGLSADALFFPTFIGLNPGGNLYVADSFNGRVLVYHQTSQSGFINYLPVTLK